jgi:hypothetical protein
MMRRLSLLALAWILGIGIPTSLYAQTTPLTAFTLGASPNPVGDQFYTTLTSFVLGSNNVDGTYIPPDGSVAFYVSNSSTSCSAYSGGSNYVAAVGANGIATVNYYGGSAGTFPICASYIPGVSDVYAASTAGVYLLTVNQPTIFTVNVPAAAIQGTPITFTFGITTPSGQTPPTGTVTLEDPNLGGLTIGTATVTGGVVSPTSVSATLSSNSYYAIYSGDSNYASESVSGTVLIENALSSIVPAAVTAGSAATSVTLNGLGFTGNSQVELLTAAGQVALPVTSQTTTQIQTTIPATYLQNPGQVSLEVVTGTVIGGPVQLQVYAPYTDSIAISSPPTAIPYGSTASATLNAIVTRGVPTTDAAVPAGQVSFNLTGAGYSATLGTAPLSQVSSQGTYLNPFTEPMDTFGTGKLIAADLNNDGFVDVVGLPSFGPSQGAASPFLQVMLSTGVNAFQTEAQVFTGCQESDFAVGDINGDTIPDLVVVCNSTGYASGSVSNLVAYYMLGNGDGSFQQPVAFGANSFIGSPTQVVLGQFNADGYLDIAVIDGVNGLVQVLSPFGNPGNPYGPEVGFDVSYGSVVTAGAADFNQDGLSDIAVEEYSYQYGTGAVFALLSQGNFNGFYVPSESLFSSNAYYLGNMAITDVNGDGYPDIAIADPGIPYSDGDTGNLLVFENDQSGNLNETFDDPVNSIFSVAGVPFPAIGQPAPGAAVAPGWNLVLTYLGANNDLWVSELQRQSVTSWTGIGSFDTTLLAYNNDSSNLPDYIVTGDMNGDGYLDFALNGTTYTGISQCPANDCDLQPWYYSNDAQASLTSSTQLPTPGAYTLNVSYPGDQLYQPSSTTTGSTIQIVQATPTGVLLGPGTITFGATATFYATVNGVNNGVSPSGVVTFYDGGNPIGTSGLTPAGGGSATGQFSTTLLAPGPHTITIGYSGDANYLTANPIASTFIQVSATSISLGLTSSTTATTSGAMVNFQVQASGPVLPAGQSVSLTGLPSAGAITVTLNSVGFASFNYGLFPPANYTIGAAFAGNTSFTSAVSNTVALQVSATPVSVSLASDANPVTYPATFDLTATASTNGLGVPTGAIGFQNNGAQFNTGTLATVEGSSGLTSVGTIDPVTGQTVIALATGHFSNVGNQDIAALETGGGAATLLISVGNGDGTFQAPVTYSSTTFGFDPTSVGMAAADFNGDGYTDLVIIASNGEIAVILAAGDAAGDMNIAQAQLIPVSYTPIAVATGDFNGDGNQDFAVIGSNSVTAYYGTGSTPANFPAAGSWSSTSSTSSFTGIAVANFDQGIHAEIAVSDNSGPDVAVYLWNGAVGTFGSAQTYPVGISATAIASGDVDGDGFPDLAVVSNLDSTVDVLINIGTTQDGGAGTFGLATSYGVATQPAAITMADFNQDGYADIAVSGTGTGQGGGTTILLGSSTGAMGGETSLPTALGQAIASADFNGDGNPDLVVGLSGAASGAATFVDSAAQLTASAIALPAGTAPLTGVYSSTSGQFAGATSSILNEVVNQATPLIAWAAPAPITFGTPLSPTQLDAVPSVPGTLTYSPLSGVVLPAGPQTLTVSFVPNDAVDYAATTAQVPITVNAAATTVTWANPAPITYGTALGAAQLDATASVPGTFTYTPALGSIPHAGLQTLTVAFTPNDSTDYTGSTGSVKIQVNQAIPLITWVTPAAITYGARLTAAQLDATASTAGTFTYTPALGALLTAGAQTLKVSFAPADAVDYTTANGSAQLQVNQAAPVITWANPAAISYGTTLSTTQLNATATPAGGTFTYTPPVGTTLPVGSQTLRVSYTPPDTVDYAVANAQVPITVNQATTTVNWPTPAAITYGTLLSAVQLNATSSVPGTFTYTPALGALLTAGTQTLRVTFTPNNAGYSGATGSVQLQVNQATSVITWATPAPVPYGTKLGATQLDATASTAGTLTYTPAAGTALSGGIQTLRVSFTPNDTVDYTTATGSVQIQVNPATPVITWANPAAISYGVTLSATQLNATATPTGGTFTYTPPVGTTLPVGTQTLKVTYAPSAADAANYTSATDSVSIVVNPGLVLTSILPTSASYGAAATTITLTGTGFSAGSIVNLNGAAIPTTYFSETRLTAVIPASFLTQTSPGNITVTGGGLTTSSVPFTVTLPNIQLEFTGPGTEPAGQQPTLNLAFLEGYPLPLQVSLTLAVKPATSGGPVDPAVQFSTGGGTFSFTLPANSTTVPTIQLQTGTLASTITVTLTLESDGQDVTPAGLAPVVIVVPPAAPVITSVTLERNGTTLTVIVLGYSTTRDMTSADFTFSPASGDTISDPQLAVDLGTSFTGWYGQADSILYGSAFTYTQNFTLNNAATTIGSVSVKLTNSIGTSAAGTAN